VIYESILDLRGEKLRLLREHLRYCGQKICPEVNSNSNSEYSEPRMERLGGYRHEISAIQSQEDQSGGRYSRKFPEPESTSSERNDA
jgi:hypothetical protein